MKYQQIIEKLYSLSMHGGVKLGLSNIQRLCEAFQHPEKKFSSVHIAGTNGKGSVSKKTASALQHSGKKVGLYTSPHISCFRERIQINGKMVSETDIEELLPSIFEMTERAAISATFFEVTTLLAFLYFAKNRVDIVVLETGLGGRLDATNVVTPILSIITSISLDHTEILGNSVEEIAKEKAGIIKPKIPVVIGPRTPQQYFEEHAANIGSPCACVQEKFATYEEENNAIARAGLKVLRVPEEHIKAGLQSRLPCRMEQISDSIILDVAHNPDGLQQLFGAIYTKWPQKKLRIVCGLSKSKDLHSCLKIIAGNATAIHLVAARNQRSASIDELSAILDQLGVGTTALSNSFKSIPSVIKEALELSKANNELLVVCGTFFIMSEVRLALGIVEACDPFELQ